MTTPPPGPLHDWITIWQSECAARALDRDTQDVFLAAVTRWAEAARAMAALWPAAAVEQPPTPRPDAPPGPAPAVAASRPRDPALAELESRVAELERRLAMDHRRRG